MEPEWNPSMGHPNCRCVFVLEPESKSKMPKQVPATDDLIALICKAASEKYREDKVRPGIQIAHIPAEEIAKCFVDSADKARGAEVLGLKHGDPIKTEPFWYVALHRYPNPVHGGYHTNASGQTLPPGCPEVRRVVLKAKHDTLDRAVQLLALQLLPVEAQAELAAAIKGLK